MKPIQGKGDEQFATEPDDELGGRIPWYMAAAVIFIIGPASWAVGVFG